MTKFQLSTLVLALAFGVSACSSNSGGNEDVGSKEATKVTDTQNSTPNTSETTNNPDTANNGGKNANSTGNTVKPNAPTTNKTPSANPTPTSDITGVAYHFASGASVDSIKDAKLIDLASDDKNILKVGGQTIELAPNGLMPGYTLTRTEDGNILMTLGSFVDGTDYMPNTQFGVFADKANDTTYVFTQGKVTPEKDMPVEGSVRYTGLAAYHLTNSSLNKAEWPVYGVDLTANFAEKTLKGNLTMSNAPNIPIDTEIKGNTFSSDKNSDTQVKGQFYGEKAKELGGVYVNEKAGYAGAFSAKQW